MEQRQRDEQERQLEGSLSTSPSTAAASEHTTMLNETLSSYPSTSGSRDPGPLPLKIGELGFVEGVSSTLTSPPMIHQLASTETLSGPHPAERERDAHSTRGGVYEHHRQSRHQHADSEASSILPPLPNSSSASLPLVGRRTSQQAAAESSTTSLTPSQTSSRSLLKHFTPSPLSKSYLLGGTPRTALRLFIQLLILGGTVVGWIFAIKDLKAIPVPSDSDPSNNGNGNSASSLSGSGSIFIHVAFTVGVLIQLLFLERCVFLLRAERYMFLHPSSTELPTHFSSRRNVLHLQQTGTAGHRQAPRVAYVPWNRPPLPTYAAALGYRGTGDTEDNEIARVFAIGSGEGPPQYGNTRGSTLLAYGIGGRRSSARGGGRRGSIGSQISERDESTPRPERPVSYGHSEQIEDAFRAQKLEQALAKLESGSSVGH